MLIALYQPDIAANLGSMLRLCACLGIPLHIIEPCGFPLDDRRMRRVAMDYTSQAILSRHASWSVFCQAMASQEYRLVLLTTRSSEPHTRFTFTAKDALILGRESAGVPAEVHDAAHARIRIPIKPETRSLNIVQAACIAAAEALRQTNSFPPS